jgi:hypothetical protein
MRQALSAIAAACALAACTSSTPSQPGAVVGFGGAATEVGAPAAGKTPRTYVAHLNGDGEVPARDTDAQGQVIFQLNPAGTELSYRLISSNIENVVASHIHLGPADANGPIVQFLFGTVPSGGGSQDGVLATGTIDGSTLMGSLAGQGLSALIAAMEAGNTYVNVHTNDGVSPTNTGPGDFPGGEVRGQIRIAGPKD